MYNQFRAKMLSHQGLLPSAKGIKLFQAGLVKLQLVIEYIPVRGTRRSCFCLLQRPYMFYFERPAFETCKQAAWGMKSTHRSV